MLFDQPKYTTPAGSVIVDDPPVIDKKDNKKTYILAGLVSAVILTVLVVLLVIFMGNSSDNKMANSFNNYARFILFGTEDIEEVLIEPYDASEVYTIEEKIADGDVAYFERAKEKWYDFLELYQKSYIQDSNFLKNIEENQDSLEFLYFYVKNKVGIDKLDNGELLQKYLADGAEKTKSYVKDVFDEMASSDSKLAKKYSEANISYYGGVIDWYDMESEAGCIANNSITEACGVDMDELNDSRISDNIFIIQDTMLKARNHILEDCWVIGGLLDTETANLTESIDDIIIVEEGEDGNEE